MNDKKEDSEYCLTVILSQMESNSQQSHFSIHENGITAVLGIVFSRERGFGP